MSYVSSGACSYCFSRDASATYDDGSKYCFSCCKYTPGNAIKRLYGKFMDKIAPRHLALEKTLPKHAVEWLQQYEITLEEMKEWYWYNIDKNLLVFKYKDWHNGRRLHVDNARRQPKYHSWGEMEHPIIVPRNPSYKDDCVIPLVIVEDAVSAIKVARVCHAVPLFGSNTKINTVLDILNNVPLDNKKIYVWLDFDKSKESIKLAKKLNCVGVHAHAIVTINDPKTYSINSIKRKLDV